MYTHRWSLDADVCFRDVDASTQSRQLQTLRSTSGWRRVVAAPPHGKVMRLIQRDFRSYQHPWRWLDDVPRCGNLTPRFRDLDHLDTLSRSEFLALIVLYSAFRVNFLFFFSVYVRWTNLAGQLSLLSLSYALFYTVSYRCWQFPVTYTVQLPAPRYNALQCHW